MNYSEYRKELEKIINDYKCLSKLNYGESVVIDAVRYVRDEKGRFVSRTKTLYEWLVYLFNQSKDKVALSNVALSLFRSQVVISGTDSNSSPFGAYTHRTKTKKNKDNLFYEAEQYASAFAGVFSSILRPEKNYNLYYSGESLKSIDNTITVIREPLGLMFNYSSSMFVSKPYFNGGRTFGLNKTAFDFLINTEIIPIIVNNYKGKISDINDYGKAKTTKQTTQSQKYNEQEDEEEYPF